MSSRRSASGEGERDDVEAVVQVLAELPGRLLRVEVAMRRRDDANVHGDGLGRADGPHLLLLQHAQQLHLQRQRHVADFVEEHRPAVGRLEQPLVSRTAPVNGPCTWPNSSDSSSCSGMAPQLTATKGLSAARACPVHRPRQQLLARAAVAADQHAGIACSYQLALPRMLSIAGLRVMISTRQSELPAAFQRGCRSG